VTLRVPPDRLRGVNRVLEQTAWGGFRTEFYPTYDYKTVAEEERKQRRRLVAPLELTFDTWPYGAIRFGVVISIAAKKEPPRYEGAALFIFIIYETIK
jgi:hypothetical protein